MKCKTAKNIKQGKYLQLTDEQISVNNQNAKIKKQIHSLHELAERNPTMAKSLNLKVRELERMLS